MGLLPTVESITKHTRRSSDASSINASGSGSPSSKYAGGGGGVGGGEGAVDGRPDDVEVLDKEEGNIVLSMISQLRIGMDLSKITFPTFVLEPRSMLERITDFMAHPDLMFGAGQIPDPKQRFLQVTALILAGWHIKPKGVKKPYNPVLGEFFRCTYTYPDGSEGFYIAEQVSHHPPVSAFFYVSPKNQILVTGELKPKSKFLGNSVATVMEGENRVRLLDRPEDGEYTLTMPNMFARGILYGKMMVELGDTSTVTCPKTDFSADIEWKTKGWISGGYNAIAATVRGPSGSAGDISGHWDSVMDYKDKGGKKQTLFDATKAQAVPKAVAPETEQEPNESRRLWAGVTRAIKTHDMEAATTEKAKIEDAQRDLARRRESSGQRHQLRFFQPVGDKYMPKLDVNKLPKDPEEACRLVREFIFAANDRQPPSQPATPVKSTATSSAAQPSPVATTPPGQPADNVSVGSRDSFASATDIPIHETAPGPPAPGPKIALDPN